MSFRWVRKGRCKRESVYDRNRNYADGCAADHGELAMTRHQPYDLYGDD